MKLLIVDDEEPVAAIVGRVAQQGGWSCISKVDANGLDRVIAREKVDVLLLDYVLDGDPASPRNGLTILRELRAARIGIPVILFTGWPDLVDMGEARTLGAVELLAKPLSIQDLRASLNLARSLCGNDPPA